MVLIVSEQMQKRKKLKFQRELKRVVSKFPANVVNKFIEQVFEYHKHKPTADNFVNMTLASKFGTGNSLNEGGQGFLLETCVKVFNEFIKFDKAIKIPEGSFYGGQYSTIELWNAFFWFEIDAGLHPHLERTETDDFIWADDISPYLYLDKTTQAFGFVIVPLPPMTLDEFKEYGQDDIANWETDVETRFKKKGYAQYDLLDFSTGPMEYISPVRVQFGTVDKLIKGLPDRQRHDVVKHKRKLSSGKTTTIKAHKRKTPLRLVESSGALTDHIVYSVTDCEGKQRYIGEGKRDRPKHVNSGASHNWKINEHYFTKGNMGVKILYEGLTKCEALTIEKMLIRRSSGIELWNVKDYEPFTLDADRAMSLQDIHDCFDL